MKGIQVPYWKRMLLIAAKAVDMTGLEYLGVDLVIDRERGPLLLELNARPGLQIQIANQAGLLRRLELIDKAPPEIFATPERRVAWALDTFSARTPFDALEMVIPSSFINFLPIQSLQMTFEDKTPNGSSEVLFLF